MIQVKIKNNRSRELYDLAIKSGYDKCGIISIDATKDYSLDLDKRIDNYPDSRGFYEDYYAWANKKILYPWANSILTCGYWYGKYRVPVQLYSDYIY